MDDFWCDISDIILPAWQNWKEERVMGNEEGQEDGYENKLGHWVHLTLTWRWNSDSDGRSRRVAACFHSWAQAEEAQAPLSHSISP